MRFDLFDLHDTKGQKLNMLNMVDHATSYQMVIPIPGKRPRVVYEAFAKYWLTPFGKPHGVHADQGGEFYADFQEEMQSLGVEVVYSPRFAPFQNAQAERRGGVFKYIAQAAAVNSGMIFSWLDQSKEQVTMDTWAFTQACSHSANTLIRGHGYNPAQLASLRLPYELLNPYAQCSVCHGQPSSDRPRFLHKIHMSEGSSGCGIHVSV